MTAHNYAADSTFQDVMTRLSGTDVQFGQIWPLIRSAILSGRALTAAEYRPLNALLTEAHATRLARNEAISAPRLHSTVGETANVVISDDAPAAATMQTTATVAPTTVPAAHIEKTQAELEPIVSAAVASKSAGTPTPESAAKDEPEKASTDTVTNPTTESGTAAPAASSVAETAKTEAESKA